MWKKNLGHSQKLAIKSSGLWHRLTSLTLVTTLIVTPIPVPEAQANVAGALIGAIDSFGQGFMASMQQTMMAQQAAMMMQQLQPQIVPSTIFPQCPVPATRQNFPADACRRIRDPNEMMMAQSLMALANNYENFFTQMLSEAQNTPAPAGLQCMENNRRLVASQIQEKLNSLTNTQTQLRKNIQLFRDANREILEQMKLVSEELDGGGNGRTLADRGRDIAAMFEGNSACQEAMDPGTLSQQQGLRAVRAMFTSGEQPLRATAANMIRDQGVIRQHLDQQVQSIVADIQRDGIDRWIANQGASLSRATEGGLTQFQGLSRAIANELQVFNTERQQIATELQNVGVALPAFDQHFAQNVQGFKQNAGEFLRKRFINECVSGQGNTGVALSTDQILGSLRHIGGEQGESTINDYRLALTNILNSDAFIEDKMAQIRALEGRFAGTDIRVEFIDANAQRTFATPFELYQQTIQACSSRFETDDTFSPQATGTSGTVSVDTLSRQSRSEQIRRAEGYLNDARALEASFLSRIQSSINDRIVNCGAAAGVAQRAGQCSRPETMSTDSENFCINTAVSCAAQVQSCFSVVENFIVERETRLNNHATNFNNNMRGLIAAQEQIFQGLRAQVQADQQFLSRFALGADFVVPEGLFVEMPEMQDSEFGVRLIGGGEGGIAALENAAGKIDLLKQSLEEQKGLVDQRIAENIQAERAEIEAEKQRWATLKSECSAKVTEFENQIEAQNAQIAQQNQELDQQIGEFCYKYDRLRHTNNPTAGCEGDHSPSSLMGDANRIAAHLDASVHANLDAFNNLCGQSQSQTGSSGSGSGSGSSSPLRVVCGGGGGYQEGVIEFADSLLENATPAIRGHSNAIRNYIRGSGSLDSVDGLESGSAFRSSIDALKEAYALGTGSRSGGDREREESAPSTPPVASGPDMSAITAGLADARPRVASLPGITSECASNPINIPDAPSSAAIASSTQFLNDVQTAKANAEVRRDCINSALTTARQATPVNQATVSALERAKSALDSIISNNGLGRAIAGISGTTPSSPSRDTASIDTEGLDPCQAAREHQRAAMATCRTPETAGGRAPTRSAASSCASDERNAYLDDPTDSTGQRAQQLLSRARTQFRTSGNGVSMQQWSRVGERNAGACAAGAGTGRGVAGALESGAGIIGTALGGGFGAPALGTGL